MPKSPKGGKRPADVIGNAVHVMRIATGEIVEDMSPPDDGKDQAAVALGKKGGTARPSASAAARRRSPAAPIRST